MKFSIVIPARNEEHYLPLCLNSIQAAARFYPSQVEIIVVLNRCTDSTEKIARSFGAVCVFDENRNLAVIRNAGAKVAQGEILITIDADSQMSENTLQEIDRALLSGLTIGGGVDVRPERISVGIWLTFFLLRIVLHLMGLTAGLYWCQRTSFNAIGGFNEDLLVAEDADFAYRLRELGKIRHLKLTTLNSTYIITSCRKFDTYGDWYPFKFFLKWKDIWSSYRGKNRRFADEFFYDYKK